MYKLKFNLPSPIEKVEGHGLGIDLYVKREDLIHPLIKGNKYRKLKYNLQAIDRTKTVISFGGAFSNHIHALAAYCKYYELPCVGIIRGEEVQNEVLDFCNSCGMTLHFVDRASYRIKERSAVVQEILSKYEQHILIPEGGSNDLAMLGVKELVDEVIDTGSAYDFIGVAAGTGCTAAGILQGLIENGLSTKLLVFSALKGAWMAEEISRLAGIDKSKFYCTDQYSMGGYAKSNAAYNHFIDHFIKSTNIAIDKIYNGKLLYGLADMDANSFFESGQKVLWINSGGVIA